MAKSKPSFSSCTVKRTFVRTSGKMNARTGELKVEKTETVTEECNVPLFGDHERKVGVCRGCAGGWEVQDNRFADEAEKLRAARLGKA